MQKVLKEVYWIWNMEVVDDSGEISFREVMNMETLFVEKKLF